MPKHDYKILKQDAEYTRQYRRKISLWLLKVQIVSIAIGLLGLLAAVYLGKQKECQDPNRP